MNSSSVPLVEALPWSSSSPRTILIGDSLQSDGRFLLYTLAPQILAGKAATTTTTTTTTTTNININTRMGVVDEQKNYLLWLACGPITDRQVAMSLRKLGCESAGAWLRNNMTTTTTTTSRLSTETSTPQALQPFIIQSVAVDIASHTLENTEWDAEVYVKDLYRQIQIWLRQLSSMTTTGHAWVFLDDVSTLALLLGERFVYKLIHNLNQLACRGTEKEDSNNTTTTTTTMAFGLVIRHSLDLDQDLIQKRQDVDHSSGNTRAKTTLWVGAGGSSRHEDETNNSSYIPWERHLMELADGIIDVLPLTSGYSREAHGRLVFTERPGGRGWKTRDGSTFGPSQAAAFSMINYCFHDSGVRAIRLRGNTTLLPSRS